MASALTKKRPRRKSATPRAGSGRSTSSAAQDEHLKELMKQAVREVLVEEQWVAGDPDAGLELRPEVIERLQRQEQEYAAGQRGRPLEDVIKEMGLD